MSKVEAPGRAGTEARGRLRSAVRIRVGGLPSAFWVLWCGSLVNRLGAMVNPFLSLYLTGVRGLSVPTTGLVLGIVGVGSVISQPLGGIIADRFGRRAALTGGMLANGAVLVLLGSTGSIAVITLCGFLLGITIDLYRPASQALVADAVPVADRTRAFGLLLWSVNLGFSAAMMLGGYIATHGFHLLFWIDAGACAIFGLMVWLAVPETHTSGADRAAGSLLTVVRDHTMLAFAGVVVLYAIVFQQAFATLPLAMRHSGLSGEAYGWVMAVNGIVVVSMQPIIGHKLSGFDKSHVLAAGFLIAACGNALASIASATAGYAVAVAVWSLGEILVFAVTASIVADLAPQNLRGRYNGLLGMAWGTGFLIAPVVGTRLLAIGAPVLWYGCIALCVLAALGQLALAPAVRCRTAG
ncbi:MFS transporter [Streptomyces sp. RB6PN25]|uniref:MFS transporter n=1 Tax=Streptomyces humicola TaxID=2953240 RepID=A0ABT1PTU0_9ACTN|nr:MFS transporter [Streptomyces humicola]MCQ4081087.1 MFS transporter [Streptomyces humicola]